jgi:hypothetical protein
MGFGSFLKSTINPFSSKNRLSPLNAPGMGKIGALMGRAPGMQTIGNAIPGARQGMALTPGMRGMMQKPGIGPSVPPQLPPPVPMEGAPMIPPQGPVPQPTGGFGGYGMAVDPNMNAKQQFMGNKQAMMAKLQGMGPSPNGLMGGLKARMMQMRGR